MGAILCDILSQYGAVDLKGVRHLYACALSFPSEGTKREGTDMRAESGFLIEWF